MGRPDVFLPRECQGGVGTGKRIANQLESLGGNQHIVCRGDHEGPFVVLRRRSHAVDDARLRIDESDRHAAIGIGRQQRPDLFLGFRFDRDPDFSQVRAGGNDIEHPLDQRATADWRDALVRNPRPGGQGVDHTCSLGGEDDDGRRSIAQCLTPSGRGDAGSRPGLSRSAAPVSSPRGRPSARTLFPTTDCS